MPDYPKILASFILTLLPLVASNGQSPSPNPAILRYNPADLDRTVFSTTKEQTKATENFATKQPDIISLLLSKAGKNEQKAVRKILEAGREQRFFSVEKLQKKLGKFNIPTAIDLYYKLKAIKIQKFDLNNLNDIKTTLATIDAAIKQAKNSPVEQGNLSFFAGLTRDHLANVVPNESERKALRYSALANYNNTIANLSEQTDKASKEKVDDAKERVVSIENVFGKVVPISSKSGNSKIYITSDYGMRMHPVKKTKRFHSGVDLAGWKCKGWKVLSIGPGRVIKSGWETGYGYVVILSHEINGKLYYTRYAHLKKNGRIKVGTIVKPGQLLGYCNNSGISTGSHLHFEVRKNSFSGQTLDPKQYLPAISILR
ncbi:MAG: hypothetical protein Kow0029_00760 [Candidatus Rifleibacteriota bacterium]